MLVRYVDQLNFLYYDTQINDLQVFENNGAHLLSIIDKLYQIADIEYLVSIATFTNHPDLQKYHDPLVESIYNTLSVLKNSQLNNNKLLGMSGISIFCDWETDNNEWRQFRETWIR